MFTKATITRGYRHRWRPAGTLAASGLLFLSYFTRFLILTMQLLLVFGFALLVALALVVDAFQATPRVKRW